LDTAKYQWCMSRLDVLDKAELFFVEPLDEHYIGFALNKMYIINSDYQIIKEFRTPFQYRSKL